MYNFLLLIGMNMGDTPGNTNQKEDEIAKL